MNSINDKSFEKFVIDYLNCSGVQTSIHYLRFVFSKKNEDKDPSDLILSDPYTGEKFVFTFTFENTLIYRGYRKNEDEDFGTCEECGCELDYMPNAGWGVGYVCAPCAHKLRGEWE